jgi:hypothetical protein
LQSVFGKGHAVTHTPPSHSSPAAHVFPHAPQFAGVPRSTSQPSSQVPLQSAKPEKQRPTAHFPVVHFAAATLDLRSSSQPWRPP